MNQESIGTTGIPRNANDMLAHLITHFSESKFKITPITAVKSYGSAPIERAHSTAPVTVVVVVSLLYNEQEKFAFLVLLFM